MAASLAKSLWFFSALSSWFYFYPSENSDSNGPPAEVEVLKDVYDFVIIGGGTGGCVVASRLSEDPSTSVLLLEAGGQESHEGQIPAVAPYLQLTELDWQYKTVPSSTSCLAMNDNRCNLPRGKVIGGSSSINLLLYVRGNKRDYDQWEAFGNPGWSYEKVLPYFIKSENNKNSTYSSTPRYHGVEGYQPIQEPQWKTPLAEAFLEGGKEMGYETLDINAESQTGFMFPQGFHQKGSRYSAARSFLQPIRERENLNIKLHALVTRIGFDVNKRANFVFFERANRNFSVRISKEVILCAGAFGSPQILMLSGIGPSSHLKNVGIEPIVSLPVGRNLQDHIAGHLPFSITEPMSIKRKRMESFAAVYQYIVRSSGPLATFGAVEGIGFVHTRYSNRSLDWPDIQLQFISSTYASDKGKYLRHTLNLREEYWDDYLKPLSDLDGFTVMFKLLRPRSKGYIELESSNPKHMPKVVPNYLTEPVDILTLIEGLKIAKSLGETKPFKRLGSKLYMNRIPGCEGHFTLNDEYLDCYLRHLTFTIYHYSGTAKMGPYWDPESVVDSQLRVYGVSGVRVVDASVFPTIPSGNTNAAVMMVAEKASDMVKAYWKGARKVPTLINAKDKTTEQERISMFELLKPHFLIKRELKQEKVYEIPASNNSNSKIRVVSDMTELPLKYLLNRSNTISDPPINRSLDGDIKTHLNPMKRYSSHLNLTSSKYMNLKTHAPNNFTSSTIYKFSTESSRYSLKVSEINNNNNKYFLTPNPNLSNLYKPESKFTTGPMYDLSNIIGRKSESRIVSEGNNEKTFQNTREQRFDENLVTEKSFPQESMVKTSQKEKIFKVNDNILESQLKLEETGSEMKKTNSERESDSVKSMNNPYVKERDEKYHLFNDPEHEDL